MGQGALWQEQWIPVIERAVREQACLGTAVNLAGETGQPSSCLTCGSIGQTEDKKHNNLLIQKFPGGQQAGEWEINWAEAATERGGKQPQGMERAGETLNHYISVSFPMKELSVMEELRRWPKCLDSFTLLLWRKAIYIMRLIVLTDQGNNKYRECIISCLQLYESLSLFPFFSFFLKVLCHQIEVQRRSGLVNWG